MNLAINGINHSMLLVKRGQRHFGVTPEECSSHAIKFKEKAKKSAWKHLEEKVVSCYKQLSPTVGTHLLYYLNSLHQSNICRRKMISHWNEQPSRT